MTLSELRSLLRLYVPHALTSVITDIQLNLILNEGVNDIASRTLCLPADTKFNAVADQQDYDLSSVVSRFLVIDKEGLFWTNGTRYKQLLPKTMKWLDENRPNWRDEGSGEPLYYLKRGSTLKVIPEPDTSTSDGFWLYFGQGAVTMTNDTHYPFSGSTTEITRLSIFDEAIILYGQWKILRAMGKKDEALSGRQEYLAEVIDQMTMTGRQRDIASAKDTRLQGPILTRII